MGFFRDFLDSFQNRSREAIKLEPVQLRLYITLVFDA